MERDGASRLRLARLHHSGAEPVRVLLIGDAAHLHEDLPDGSPAQRICDRIWLTTRFGVDLDVLTDLSPVVQAVRAVFATWRLWRYDVVLVALGDGADHGVGPRSLARVGELLRTVLSDVAGSADVVVLTPAGIRTDRLRDTIDALGTPRIRFREVPPVDDAIGRARAWATACAEEVAAFLRRAEAAPALAAALRDRPDDEEARQRALDTLGIVGRGPDARLDDLVELARTAFGTDSAEINFIDRDRQWKMAVANADRGDNPRAHSFCNLTIQRATPTIIPDAQCDPLLRGSPLAQGPNAIRFYVAHPIESADGYRIGSFCIYDHEPRDVSGLNLDVLRDLALLAQAEIVGDARPAGAAMP